MNYYISDLHWGHKNVLNFDSRPFENIDEMRDKMIENWNKTVTDNDDVYILGDCVWKNSEWENIHRLNGRKHLILGNHDRISAEAKSCFVSIDSYKEIKDNGYHVVLCHFPIASFNRAHHGAVHLYGHIHNSWESGILKSVAQAFEKHFERPYLAYNVGCMMDYMDYTPRTLQYILRSATRPALLSE